MGDILSTERELARVRTELERFQGQINFLKRRVDLATIIVSLFAPQARFSEPPSASIGLESTEVTRRVEETKTLIASVDGEVDQVFTSGARRRGAGRSNCQGLCQGFRSGIGID